MYNKMGPHVTLTFKIFVLSTETKKYQERQIIEKNGKLYY